MARRCPGRRCPRRRLRVPRCLGPGPAGEVVFADADGFAGPHAAVIEAAEERRERRVGRGDLSCRGYERLGLSGVGNGSRIDGLHGLGWGEVDAVVRQRVDLQVLASDRR